MYKTDDTAAEAMARSLQGACKRGGLRHRLEQTSNAGVGCRCLEQSSNNGVGTQDRVTLSPLPMKENGGVCNTKQQIRKRAVCFSPQWNCSEPKPKGPDGSGSMAICASLVGFTPVTLGICHGFGSLPGQSKLEAPVGPEPHADQS